MPCDETAAVSDGRDLDIELFHTPGLGDNSYLVSCSGQAVLVDAQRDVGRFLAGGDGPRGRDRRRAGDPRPQRLRLGRSRHPLDHGRGRRPVDAGGAGSGRGRSPPGCGRLDRRRARSPVVRRGARPRIGERRARPDLRHVRRVGRAIRRTHRSRPPGTGRGRRPPRRRRSCSGSGTSGWTDTSRTVWTPGAARRGGRAPTQWPTSTTCAGHAREQWVLASSTSASASSGRRA